MLKKNSGPGYRAGAYSVIGLLGAVIVFIAVVGLAVVHFTEPSGLNNLKGKLLTALFLKKPSLQYIEMEMNGKDLKLTASDFLDISYRDEFVVKRAVTDSIISSRIRIEPAGFGPEFRIGALVKGVQVVDRAINESLQGKAPGKHSIRIIAGKDILAEIPVQVNITPQDWLRLAKVSDKESDQVDFFKRALAANPEDTNVRKMLAAVYTQKGKGAQAAAEYIEIIRLKPDDLAAHIELAKIYIDKNQYADALQIFRKIVQLNPKDAAANANMALCYEKTGHIDQAAAELCRITAAFSGQYCGATPFSRHVRAFW